MPPPTQTTKTRICIISDTHTFPPNPPSTTSNPYRAPLPTANILLHAGDLTKVSHYTEHLTILSLLKSAPAELKLVIAGNHDITLDEPYYASLGHFRHRYRSGYTAPSAKSGASKILSPEDEGPVEELGRARALWTSPEAREAGIVYLEEGTHRFTISTGATFTVYASQYTPEFCQWAFAYERSEDRYNPLPAVGQQKDNDGPANPVPDFPAVDIMLTHGPPYGVLDEVIPGPGSVGCEHLFRAAGRARPRLHVFGHIHEGYGATRLEWRTGDKALVQCDEEKTLRDRGAYVDVSRGEGEEGAQPLRFGEETLFVNASVVTVDYRPVNAPWVVDLELPVRS